MIPYTIVYTTEVTWKFVVYNEIPMSIDSNKQGYFLFLAGTVSPQHSPMSQLSSLDGKTCTLDKTSKCKSR